jgi:hypothetical protein
VSRFNLLFIVVVLHVSNCFDYIIHAWYVPYLTRSDVNLFGIDACMRVFSIGISKEIGRGMRYRLHLVAFMTCNASLSVNVSSTPRNADLNLDLPLLGRYVDLKPSFVMNQVMYAYRPPLPGIPGLGYMV